MMNTRQTTDIDGFVRRFRDYPRERAELIGRLIEEHSILTLNIPRRGPARLIAERLKEGSFSDFYEFQKALARSLHPLLANLNLNVAADIQVNAVFEKKYRRYSKRFQRILAGDNHLTLGIIKDLILEMTAHDGHHMVIKFYDLVLRPMDPGLFREVRRVEIAVMEMKNGLVGDAGHDGETVRGIYRAFGKRYGAGTAGLLAERVSWDDDLSRYIGQSGDEDHEDIGHEGGGVPDEDREDAGEGTGDQSFSEEETMEDEAPATDDAILLEEIGAHQGDAVQDTDGLNKGEPEEAEPVEEDARERRATRTTARPSGGGTGRMARYAEILRDDFLLGKRPDDEEGIRGLVGGIYAKNELRFGADRAAEIIHAVLSLWIKDEKLNGWMRGTLSDILDERSGTSSVHEGPDDFIPVDEETAPESADTGEGIIIDDVIEAEPEAVETGEDITADEAARPGDGVAVDESIALDEGGEAMYEAAEAHEETPSGGEASMEEQAVDLPDTSEEELRALLSGIGDMPAEKEPEHESEAPSDRPGAEEMDGIAAEDIVQAGEVPGAGDVDGVEFLISEEEYRESADTAVGSGDGKPREDDFLIEEALEGAGNLDEVEPVDIDLEFEADNPAGKRFAARSTQGDEPAPDEPLSDKEAPEPDSFIVKDELLFEDSSLQNENRKDGRD